MSELETVTIEVGGVWEFDSWEVQYNIAKSTYRSVHHYEDAPDREYSEAEKPCPHAVDFREGETRHYPEPRRYSSGSVTYTETETQFHWTVPRGSSWPTTNPGTTAPGSASIAYLIGPLDERT